MSHIKHHGNINKKKPEEELMNEHYLWKQMTSMKWRMVFSFVLYSICRKHICCEYLNKVVFVFVSSYLALVSMISYNSCYNGRITAVIAFLYDMAAIINYIWGFFVSEEDVAGLTGKERNLITKSWNKIMEQPTQNGILIFMRLFEIQPKHKLAFPFRDIPTKDLPNNNVFKAHVNSVMYSISSVVSNLRNEEILMAILNKLGTSHATRSVDRQALIDVKEALLSTAFMGKPELAAWNKLMDVFIDVVSKALEEKIKENNKRKT